MPKNPVFDQARGKATPELVQSLTSSEGAYWDGDEWWCLSPLRSDSSVGSFSVNGRTGVWYDNATGEGGDLIELIVRSNQATNKVKAAEMIVKALGGTVEQSANGNTPAPSHLDKPKRVKAIIPAPDTPEAKEALNARVKGKWAQENRGTPAGGWAWRMADGNIWCWTVRYNKADGGKDVIAHYWGEDQRWHEGNPIPTGRHLYRADQLARADSGTKILIVEGEKKASVKVEGYLVTTWIGGAQSVTKSDWSPLERFASQGLVTIWPDADEPGLKAGSAIVRRLTGARMLDIKGKPAGWDLADAVAEGVDPVAFIAGCPMVGGPSPTADAPARPDDGAPFLCLGYDQAGYYFMRKDRRVVFTIGMGSFNGSKLGELAPISWWQLMGMTTDQQTIKISLAQDNVTTMQDQVGFFDPIRVRGAGVWSDRDGVILNTGDRIVTMDGRSLKYTDFPSDFYYVPSKVSFGQMYGPESTDEDGRQLEKLFLAQEFIENSMAIITMGWSLISTFAGVLTWRPHIWVTGRKGSGKSWMWTNLMQRMSGPFAFIANGKTTVAGAMRALDQDIRPAYFGEMEPKGKSSREKIESILELARNASDDSASDTTMSDSGGGVRTFKTRSPMAFMSTMIPIEDGATTSRITTVELKTSADQSAKFAKSAALMSDLMDDPGRFTRRIFHALPRIISDIEYIKAQYIGVFGSQRAVDQVAPMLAAAWAVQSDKSVRESGMWIEKWLVELAHETKSVQDDEDTFMGHLLGLGLRTDENKTRTVAELLTRVADANSQDPEESALRLLERHGITIRRKYGSSPWVLSIATRLPKLAELFRDTLWGDAYGDQIKRNPYTEPGPTRSIRMVCGKPRCHDLEWDGFRERYLGKDDAGPELFDSGGGEDGIPF